MLLRQDSRRARAGGEIGVFLGAEEPLEDEPRIGDARGIGRVFVAPGDVVLIGAGVAAIASARLPAARYRNSAPAKASRVVLPICLRGDLIGRNADLDIRAGGLARVDAGEEAGVGARVIAGAVAQARGH